MHLGVPYGVDMRAMLVLTADRHDDRGQVLSTRASKLDAFELWS